MERYDSLGSPIIPRIFIIQCEDEDSGIFQVDHDILFLHFWLFLCVLGMVTMCNRYLLCFNLRASQSFVHT